MIKREIVLTFENWQLETWSKEIVKDLGNEIGK